MLNFRTRRKTVKLFLVAFATIVNTCEKNDVMRNLPDRNVQFTFHNISIAVTARKVSGIVTRHLTEIDCIKCYSQDHFKNQNQNFQFKSTKQKGVERCRLCGSYGLHRYNINLLVFNAVKDIGFVSFSDQKKPASTRSMNRIGSSIQTFRITIRTEVEWS